MLFWASWFLDLIRIEFVVWAHLKGYVHTVHAKTIDLMVRLDTGVTMISVNVFQCVCVSVPCGTLLSAWKRTKTAVNSCCNNKVPMS